MWQDRVLKLVWYTDQGRSRVAGRVWGWINEPLQLLTFAGVFGLVSRNWVVMGMAFSLPFLLFVIGGRWYVKSGLYRKELDFANNQNVMLMQVLNEVKEVKDKLLEWERRMK